MHLRDLGNSNVPYFISIAFRSVADWEIDAGDKPVHKIEGGVIAAINGVLVVTPSALSRPWVLEEYNAMMTRAIEEGFRLVPVLLADAEMPAFLASRAWVDFRDAYGPEYEKKVRELARVLKRRNREHPPATGELIPPKGDGFRPEGPIHRTLRIGKERVEFIGGWKTASHRPRGILHEDENRLYELEQLRYGDILYREKDDAAKAAMVQKVDRVIERAGASLTRAFLEGEAGEALCRAVSEAASLGASLRLALEISDKELFNLPWETL